MNHEGQIISSFVLPQKDVPLGSKMLFGTKPNA